MKKRKNDNETTDVANNRKVQKNSGVAGISLIIFLIDKLSDVIYNALIKGFFGRIFTAYSSELSAYDKGCLKYFFRKESKIRYYFRKLREYLSKSFETSFLLGKLRKGIGGMAAISIRSYGRFFLSFGIYTLLVYFIKILVPRVGSADTDYLFVGLGICIISFPLLFSRQTLAHAVKRSKVTEAIFVDGFGYRDEAFSVRKNKGSAHSGHSIMVGLVAGLLTFFVHPLLIIVTMLIAVIFALVIITPEIGILACLFGLPFFSFTNAPTFMITIMVLVTAFAYIIKLVRGKRILRFELVDFAVLVFLLSVYFSGVITVGGSDSQLSAVITCTLMLGYFLVVNLIRTEKWLHRCVIAVISSATIVSVIGILQYVSGAAIDNWIDKTYFTDIGGRVTSLFENPNYLAAYLAVTFPIALYQTVVSKQRQSKALGSVACVLIVVCAILTWSRAAWIAMLICGILFFMIFSRKTMRYILLFSIAVPFLPFVLPKNIVTRFLSIGDMADSSTLYRFYTWKGSLSMIKDNLFGGIGYGADAFAQLYPMYAYAGIETAAHSHSLYLQILIGMGLGGLICFFALIVLYAQNSFEYIKKPYNRESLLLVSACLCGVIAMLIMGIFDFVWYNYRILFIFWAILALGVAGIRVGKKEISRNTLMKKNDSNFATLDLEIMKRS